MQRLILTSPHTLFYFCIPYYLCAIIIDQDFIDSEEDVEAAAEALAQLPAKPSEDVFDTFRDFIEMELLDMVYPIVQVPFREAALEHVSLFGGPTQQAIRARGCDPVDEQPLDASRINCLPPGNFRMFDLLVGDVGLICWLV